MVSRTLQKKLVAKVWHLNLRVPYESDFWTLIRWSSQKLGWSNQEIPNKRDNGLVSPQR